MPSTFGGFDHLDVRVRSLAAVEPFYDRLLPLLGLVEKRDAHVDAAGDWSDVAPDRARNVVEYYEAPVSGTTRHFIGFIEDPQMLATQSRIAFRVTRTELETLGPQLSELGACDIEPSVSAEYPAIFFNDPAGTRLEICARPPSA